MQVEDGRMERLMELASGDLEDPKVAREALSMALELCTEAEAMTADAMVGVRGIRSHLEDSVHEYATAAMVGLLQKYGVGQGEQWIAEHAYSMARFMLMEREKRREDGSVK